MQGNKKMENSDNLINKNLTARQERFISEYMIDLNASAAAIRAGYSPRSAYRMAADLLQNPRIQAVLSERMAERERRTEITQDAVLREIARIAFVDPSEIFQIRSGCVVVADTDTMTEDARRALVSVTETTTKDGGSLRVQLASKLEALQLLGKHLGMFPVESRVKADVKAEIDGNVSVGVLVLPAADLGEE